MEMITLLSDLLLIKRREPETLSAGGIVIPDVAAEELQEGVVIATGPGKFYPNGKAPWRRPMEVKVGDHVLFSKHGHMPVKLYGEDYVTLHEESVVGVVDGE
jgi:chaperonin GroES